MIGKHQHWCTLLLMQYWEYLYKNIPVWIFMLLSLCPVVKIRFSEPTFEKYILVQMIFLLTLLSSALVCS